MPMLAGPKRRRSWPLALLTLALATLTLLALSAPVAHAHELGKTHVTVTFTPSGDYVIDITADPQALLAKLEILAGSDAPRSATAAAATADQLAAQINAPQHVLLANVHVTFDGTPDEPTFAYVAAPPPSEANSGASASAALAATSALVRLAGRVPPGARSFRFAYDLVLGAYPLTIGARTVWLTGGQPSEPFTLASESAASESSTPALTRAQIARQYVVLGFEHIVPKGIDHILFVLGIFLLTAAWRSILLQVTTFTIAHSITLGLTIYGLVSVPPAIVEPLIALSIVYVAIENLFTSTLKPSRLALVFAFGLLHGMGFAGVLKDLGLPRSEFVTALVTFNLGVEGGQLAVIATALVALGWWRRHAVIPASVTIAAVGAYWTITRAITALA
jgi:hypothetical protein